MKFLFAILLALSVVSCAHFDSAPARDYKGNLSDVSRAFDDIGNDAKGVQSETPEDSNAQTQKERQAALELLRLINESENKQMDELKQRRVKDLQEEKDAVESVRDAYTGRGKPEVGRGNPAD